MSKKEGYFPLDLDDDPARYGLISEFRDTPPFGRLHVLRSAVQQGRCATLFLHGVANTWTTWTPLLSVAQERGTPFKDLVLVDLPGFGESENTSEKLASQVVGDALLKIVRELKYNKVRIVGHSMGGFLTLDMASRQNTIIRSIHLVAGAYFSVIKAVQEPLASVFSSPTVTMAYWAQELLAGMGGGSLRAVQLTRQAKVMPLLLSGFVSHPWKVKESFLISLADGMRPKSFLLAAQNGQGYDPYTRWANIRCPIFGVFGDGD